MALLDWSILTLDELKSHLVIAGDGQDERLEEVINDTTEDFENYLDRDIVARAGNLIEYHTMSVGGRNLVVPELRQRQWPIISVTEVCEDTFTWPRTYAVSTRLTVDVDYQIVKGQRDFLRRLNTGFGSSARNWGTGLRAVRLAYRGGYANTGSVPRAIKTQAKKYAALLWREIDRKMQGVSGQSDAMGNFQRYGQANFTKEMADMLQAEVRPELYETGEPA